jgi:hypothetical protein
MNLKLGLILFGIILIKFGFCLPDRGENAVPSGRTARHKNQRTRRKK